MNDTNYIGMRYVPVFADPAQWDISRQYENLMMVTNEGETYISKQFVPTGIELNNSEYWVQISVPGGSTSGGVNYSTEEQDTGLKWIDGRTIYQRTFVERLNSISTGWNQLYSHEWYTLTNKIAINSSATYEKYNGVYSGFLMEFYKDDSGARFYSPFSLNEEGHFKVTIWYVKTTDTV